jgi:hypothetical protein
LGKKRKNKGFGHVVPFRTTLSVLKSKRAYLAATTKMSEPSDQSPEGFSVDTGPALLRQAFELWINPEINRRQAEGKLTDGIDLFTAQIVFHIDLPVEIRLNHEVKAQAQMQLSRSFRPGDPITIGDVEEIVSVDLTDDDANSAHITLIRTGPEIWMVAFNAQYNRGRARALISIASEYIQLARYALSKGFYRGFVDTLFSAVELSAKARLILIPNPHTLLSRSHKYIVTQFNMIGGKLRNAPQPHVTLVNKLSAMRAPAKYSIEPFFIEPGEAEILLQDGEEMISLVSKTIDATLAT